jgi:hypothetical protein
MNFADDAKKNGPHLSRPKKLYGGWWWKQEKFYGYFSYCSWSLGHLHKFILGYQKKDYIISYLRDWLCQCLLLLEVLF